ncbi:hypothetical protein BC826DRAFT_985687, partial [Russula brevipes]
MVTHNRPSSLTLILVQQTRSITVLSTFLACGNAIDVTMNAVHGGGDGDKQSKQSNKAQGYSRDQEAANRPLSPHICMPAGWMLSTIGRHDNVDV